MTANVSFYLIAILAQLVKSCSSQERNVLWNVLIVDHHVKKNCNYIYSLGQLKRLYNAISDKNKTENLSICFVSFKNQNREIYCLLLTAFSVARNDNNLWNCRLGQITHTIFWGAEELGERCVKITLIVSCLE